MSKAFISRVGTFNQVELPFEKLSVGEVFEVSHSETDEGIDIAGQIFMKVESDCLDFVNAVSLNTGKAFNCEGDMCRLLIADVVVEPKAYA